MPELDLRHLRYLIAVAETGSITRAARRLMITQPALSRAVQALERTVGVPLFVRQPHATELTDAGSNLLEEAYELVERSRAALERARGAQDASETLTVTVPVCDVVAVAEAGRAFEADRPGVRVNLIAREWLSQRDQLRAGRADVSFLRDCHDQRGLIVDQLAREPRMVLLRGDHPLADRERLTVSDLRDEPVTHWTGMSREDADHWTGADVDRRPRRHGPQVRNATDVLAAVVLGRAIAFVHGSTLPDSELPGLRARPVDGLSASSLAIGIPAHGANPLAAEFMEHARHRWALESS
ncbi:LysR family transcriptional regulator [Streptomyces sp. NPDC006617]|uniref:LysR family transcriptional regulator n=1 Tax=Streptomyces sp. NPDC006617 TaxID=3155354 RepID=UPI0033A29975